MQTYILQRLLLAIPTVILVTILTFLFLRVFLPANVIDQIMGEYARTDLELRAKLEKELGLSSGLPNQYAEWLGVAWFWGGPEGVLQGNLGESLYNGKPIMSELIHRVPVSLELGLWGQFSALALAMPLGVWAALRQDHWPDYGLRSLAILINALPGFWVAVLLLTFGSLWFDWAPPLRFEYLWDDPVAHVGIMLTPALLIGLTPSGGLIRLVRTQMLEVLRQDYVRTAYAKGLASHAVLYRHALRNALIPVVTVVGVGLPNVIAGTVIFEQIFLIPGMGRYLVTSVDNLDYPVILGLNLIFAVLLVLAVLIVDISYAFIDPRIRFS
ncbi:MAG TPA: ABC transporter permease [Dehalococcoidia bacterium]